MRAGLCHGVLSSIRLRFGGEPGPRPPGMRLGLEAAQSTTSGPRSGCSPPHALSNFTPPAQARLTRGARTGRAARPRRGPRSAGRRLFGLLLGALLLASAAGALRSEEDAAAILVVGDSLSAAYGMALEEGWVAGLERRLGERGLPYRVVNASISGDTTRGGVSRLADALRRHRPAIVILALGANDGLQGFPLDHTRANLAAMVRESRAAGARVLLLGMRVPVNLGVYDDAFHALYAEVALKHGVALVPFFQEGVGDRSELMQADGLHPRAEAQPRLLENAWSGLGPLLEPAPRAASDPGG